MTAAAPATPSTPEHELHWLALLLVSGLGARKTGQLIARFRTPETVFRASVDELESAGLSGAVARSIASGCAFEEAVEQQQKLRESGTRIVPLTAAAYPDRLKEIYDPPPLLFALGNLELLDTLMIGVVGTRRPDECAPRIHPT